MTALRVSDITSIYRVSWLQKVIDHDIDSLLTDSRKISNASSSAFFAIKGINHDGHHHIQELAEAGVQTFVIETELENIPSGVNVLKVDSSLGALQALASHKRGLFQQPVVGITGSNGKTIVKEWLSKMLTKQITVIKSPRSYNSQLGVALSVWDISPGFDIGIFEAGISKMGEMVKLEKVIQPTHGILTNIGTAHEEGFPSQRAKLREKLLLFKDCQYLIYRTDNPLIAEEVAMNVPARVQRISWAYHNLATIQVKEQADQHYDFITKEGLFTLPIPLTDEASLENIMHCICCMHSLGFSPKEIEESLAGLEPVDMRLKLVKGINQTYIIDDSYNNDLVGLETALNFLKHQKQFEHKTVILSDLLQVRNPDEQYAAVNQMLLEKGVGQLIGIGADLTNHAGNFDLPARFFPDTDTLLSALSTINLREQVVLVKGARPFQFERIVKRLAEKVHQTVFEINLDAITHNLNYYRGLLKPGIKTMVMVKAFAYGSGIAEVAQLLQFHKVHYLAVAYTDEGVALRKNGIHLPIMVMNTHDEDFDALIAYGLEPEIFNMKQLSSFQQAYTSRKERLPIHININTGMNRLGFEVDEIETLIAFLKTVDNIDIMSAFTHLAGADESTHIDFSLDQLTAFQKTKEKMEHGLGLTIMGHALNSAGIQRFPDHQFNMVRLGIGLYGLEASGLHTEKLETVGTLKTVISQIKKIKAGGTIGYGRKGKAQDDMTIATVAIGYADGFARAFSNGKGQMLINNQLASVIGNVCMDMTMLDITGIDANEGDEVIVFGKSPNMQQLADSIGTIPYEILTNVSERVRRVYLTE